MRFILFFHPKPKPKPRPIILIYPIHAIIMKRFLMMWLLLNCFCFCFSTQVLSSSSSSSSISNSSHLCPPEHRLILLQFKHMFVIDNSTYGSLCGDGYYYYDQPSHPKTLSWNESSTNCCSWDGVTCHHLTGHVIGINLVCSLLSGTFHPNTTLFQLPLTSLDLSFNNFQHSSIPSSIGMLAPTLTDLGLCTSSFTGPIPSEIAHLSKLIGLRLCDAYSYSYDAYPFRLEQRDFENIISNLTRLEILDLRNINMSSSIIPDSIVNLTSLTDLSLMENIGLYGQLPDGVFNLPALQFLTIWNSDGLKGSFHDVNWNISGTSPPLEYLALSFISFSGGLPDSIGHLRSLNYLWIQHCNLSGSLPGSIGNLSRLTHLSLSGNKLTGLIPHSLSNLYLSDNLIRGSIPVGLSGLPNLVDLRLDNNMLSGALPSIIFNNHSMLSTIFISRNNLSGPIPQSISNLTELYQIDLSFNNFDGTLYLDTFSNTKQLGYIDLRNNTNLSVVDAYGNLSTITLLDLSSCKLQNFPIKFLTTSTKLEYLDLSNTGVSGQIPEWIGELRFMLIFRAFNNKIKGEIPSSICNMSSLQLLDLSHNELEGPIHPCFGNFSTELKVLDLRNNHFRGQIPATYAKDNKLRILALNENQLQGPIPESLSLCNDLQVLDVGNNMINGTFPIWMDALPELEVLVLRSNKFHGFLDISKTPSPFPKLQIFDISHNEFTGPLPSYYFNNFNAMKMVNHNGTNLKFLPYGYHVSVTMTMKGFDALIQGFILDSRTIIDLSSNKFKGAIPDVVGKLVGLTLLNMSNNRLTGHIPVKLGNLVQLESLDMSSNHLTGEIPRELTSLTFLEVLNLSCNGLEGRIPQGKQFNTFPNTSYMDNKALCGTPLSRNCEPTPTPTPPPHDDSDYAFMSGFTWQAVLMGYASGLIIGLGAGCLSFYAGRPKWFATMIDEERYKIVKKYRRRNQRRRCNFMKLS